MAAGAEVPDAPDRAFVDALLRDRGVGARSASEPAWASRFRVHHKVADRFRVDGVFLAGDAAHVHSPAAGQGMNTGIADAYDLSTRIAAVLDGEAGESTLDRYEQARRAAALEVLRFTDRMTRVAMLDKPVARLLRRFMAGSVGRLPPVRRRLAMWVTGLERSPLRGDLPAVAAARHRPGTLRDPSRPRGLNRTRWSFATLIGPAGSASRKAREHRRRTAPQVPSVAGCRIRGSAPRALTPRRRGRAAPADGSGSWSARDLCALRRVVGGVSVTVAGQYAAASNLRWPGSKAHW